MNSMKSSKILVALMLVLGFGLLSCSTLEASAQTAPKLHKVLFALTSGNEADWDLLLGNIHNLIAGLPPGSVEVEVVAYSSGLNFVKKTSSAAAEIQTLQGSHVRFTACENSMRAQHVTVADLIAGVEPVPSGIVEVVTKQEQGWTYVKAGH